VAIYALLIQHADSYLTRARDKEGAGLPERIGKKAGRWTASALAHKSTKKLLGWLRIQRSTAKKR
jgi:hypothetical protein